MNKTSFLIFMDLLIHKATERGHFQNDWLNTHYSFSFADYYDPQKMGFGTLRVINDDIIAPHTGFGTHPHHNMEIITIVLEGTLTHEDSLGNKGTIQKGEIQHISAGTGIYHSEKNVDDEPVKLFQIWITPKTKNITPIYQQKKVETGLLVSPDARNNSLQMHQDAYISKKDVQGMYTYKKYDEKNKVYALIIEGTITIEGKTLSTRDAFGFDEPILLQGEASILFLEVPF